MNFIPVVITLAVLIGVVVSVVRHRFNIAGWVHFAIIFGLPFLTVVVILTLSFLSERDDSQFAFGLAAVMLFSIPSVIAYVFTATIAEFIIRKRKTRLES